MQFLTREQVFERMRSQGHTIFENDSRNFNLNVIGIRSKDVKLNKFNDQLMLAWKYQGEWFCKNYRITTLPGGYYLDEHLINKQGCAILVPDQYRGIYGIRLHRGKYLALCQTYGEVKVYRDKNRDGKFDFNPSTIESGDFGVNIHNSPDGRLTENVNSWSAGCQVFADDNEFKEFMSICTSSKAEFGNKFTYTLITA